MQILKAFFSLCCSEKDKWVLCYFSAVLNCNVCIMESLYYTSLAFVTVLKNEQDSFLCGLAIVIENKIRVHYGAGNPILNTTWDWTRDGRKIVLRLDRLDNSIELYSCFTPAYRQAEFIFEDDVLCYSLGYIESPRLRFKPGLFEWILTTVIDETVKSIK